MTAHELQTRLQSAEPPMLLYVLPTEVFTAARIPGSRNACVYETAILDNIKALDLDSSAPLVVCGAGEGSLDAATAAEKLHAAGYAHVQIFEGGLAEWKASGLPLEGTGQLPQLLVPDVPSGSTPPRALSAGPAAISSITTAAPCGSPPAKSSCARASSRAPALPST